jgi:hypothetical protein
MSAVFIFLTIVCIVAAIFSLMGAIFFSTEKNGWWKALGLGFTAVVIGVLGILSGNYADELMGREDIEMEQRCIELDGKVIYDEDTLAYSECDLPGETHD